MNIKRALGFALIAYIISVAIGMGLLASYGFDPTFMDGAPKSLLALMLLVSVVVMASVSYFYFGKGRVQPTAKNGLLFGIVSIVVGFILDFLFFLPALIRGSGLDLFDYYNSVLFISTLIAILAATTLVGWSLGIKQLTNNL